MSNTRARRPLSPLVLCSSLVGVLVLAYVGLIAVVMSYAAMTVEFSQSVKNGEAVVARLENQYLGAVASLAGVDVYAEGYVIPRDERFVPTRSATALR